MKLRITKIQRNLLSYITKGNTYGKWYDMSELFEQLKLPITKQALQCSVRFLEKKNLILKTYEVRRGKLRVIIEPKPEAFKVVRGA